MNQEVVNEYITQISDMIGKLLIDQGGRSRFYGFSMNDFNDVNVHFDFGHIAFYDLACPVTGPIESWHFNLGADIDLYNKYTVFGSLGDGVKSLDGRNMFSHFDSKRNQVQIIYGHEARTAFSLWTLQRKVPEKFEKSFPLIRLENVRSCLHELTKYIRVE